MKKIMKSNAGMTLVEILVAVAVFAVVTTGVLCAMASSARVSSKTEKERQEYETAVGSVDIALISSSLDGYNVEDTKISVEFQETGKKYEGTSAIEAQKITSSNYSGVGVVKAK